MIDIAAVDFALDADGYFWFYSVLSQVLGGVIATLGMLSVYALQEIQNSIEWHKNDLIEVLRSRGNTIEGSRDTQLRMAVKLVNKMRERGHTPEEVDLDEEAAIVSRISGMLEQREKIKRNLLYILVFISVVLAISLACLPFGNSEVARTDFWRVLFWFELVVSIGSLACVVFFITATLHPIWKWDKIDV